MAIQVKCTCGKVLRVSDESRGKKVRCPACQAVTPVDAPTPPPSLPPAEPSPEAPARRRRPAIEDQPDEQRLAKAPAPRSRPDEAEEEAPAPRRRRATDEEADEKPAPKKKSRGLLFVGLGCLSVVLLGCLGAGGLVVVLIMSVPTKPKVEPTKTPQQRLAGSWVVDLDSSIEIDDYASGFAPLEFTYREDGTYEVFDPRGKETHRYNYEVRKSDKDSAQLDAFRSEVYAQRLNPRLVNVTFVGEDVLRVDFPAKFILRRKGSKPPPGSDADKGMVLAELTGHARAVRALSVSADGKSFASADEDGVIKVWDLSQNKERHSMKAPRGPVRGLAFTRDGKKLWVAAGDSFPDWGEISTFDPVAGKQGKTLLKREMAPLGLAIHETGRRVVWVEGKRVVAWDVPADREDTDICATLDADGVDLSMKSKELTVAVGAGQDFLTWTLGRGAKVKKLQPRAEGAALKRVAISERDELAAAGSIEKGVVVWDLKGNRKLHTLEGPNFMISGLAFSQRHALLAACVSTEGVWVWQPVTGAKLAQWKTQAQDGFMPTSLAITPSGQRLITGGQDGKVRVWDLRGVRKE